MQPWADAVSIFQVSNGAQNYAYAGPGLLSRPSIHLLFSLELPDEHVIQFIKPKFDPASLVIVQHGRLFFDLPFSCSTCCSFPSTAPFDILISWG